MSGGKRKSLSDSIVQQFVKNPDFVNGSVNKSVSTEVIADKNTDTFAEVIADKNTDIFTDVPEIGFVEATIEVFKSNQKEETTRFTVDLPKSKHQKLAIVSKQLNTSMSSLARVLIEKFLDEVDREKLL